MGSNAKATLQPLGGEAPQTAKRRNGVVTGGFLDPAKCRLPRSSSSCCCRPHRCRHIPRHVDRALGLRTPSVYLPLKETAWVMICLQDKALSTMDAPQLMRRVKATAASVDAASWKPPHVAILGHEFLLRPGISGWRSSSSELSHPQDGRRGREGDDDGDNSIVCRGRRTGNGWNIDRQYYALIIHWRIHLWWLENSKRRVSVREGGRMSRRRSSRFYGSIWAERKAIYWIVNEALPPLTAANGWPYESIVNQMKI